MYINQLIIPMCLCVLYIIIVTPLVTVGAVAPAVCSLRPHIQQH